jgi:uncharacterized protein YndB with AHSA1/START domain
MKVDEAPVIVEELIHASAEAVWIALTDVTEMRKWYFPNIPDFRAEVGFETLFLVTNEGRKFPHRWKVTEVVRNARLVYDWSFDGYPGDSFVVFELSPEGDSTRLTVTATVREDFPDEIPEFRRESCVGGWEYFIQQSLKAHLERR